MAAFLLAAALNMLRIPAGFLTSYLADLTVPALLYVLSRGLARGKRSLLGGVMPWIGRTQARAAAVFFLASLATELSQIFWPRGLFAGRFDPWDIVAYGTGLLTCYVFEKIGAKTRDVSEAMKPAVQQQHGGPANTDRCCRARSSATRLLAVARAWLTAAAADERHRCCAKIQLVPERVAASPLAAERHDVRQHP